MKKRTRSNEKQAEYQIDIGVTRLLWISRERTIESFREFFTVIGDELASKIVFV